MPLSSCFQTEDVNTGSYVIGRLMPLLTLLAREDGIVSYARY